MKLVIKLALVILLVGLLLAQAQVPGTIYYQGRLTTSAGVPMNNEPNNATDGRIDLVIRIFNAETAGTEIWNQTFNDQEVNNGLFSVELSNLGTAVFPVANQVNRWLEVTVTQNGTTSTLAPRERIVSVPYAIRAGDADTVDGLHANELGGITNETDPQVDNDLANNAVPRWDDPNDELVTGTIFDDGSRVGIGTTGPENKLHIFGDGNQLKLAGYSGGANRRDDLVFKIDATDIWTLRGDNADGNKLKFIDASGDTVTFDQNGNVDIGGPTGPQYGTLAIKQSAAG